MTEICSREISLRHRSSRRMPERISRRGIEQIAIAVVFFALSSLSTLGLASAAEPVMRIWPGVAPGSENWRQKEVVYKRTPLGTVVINVTTPTLTVYLPEPRKSRGTGVVIAPGGACVALAIDLEGARVARLFQKRGITAFVLKYRTLEKRQNGIPNLDMDQACKFGIADGIQALKVIRSHATEFHIASDKLGFLGFSAGGMVASGTMLQRDAAARPNFVALMYGAPFGVMPQIPNALPPIFMAWAQDDLQARGPIVKYYHVLRSAGNKPDVHIFSSGGHGFGIGKPGTTSMLWTDEFFYWLKLQGRL